MRRRDTGSIQERAPIPQTCSAIGNSVGNTVEMTIADILQLVSGARPQSSKQDRSDAPSSTTHTPTEGIQARTPQLLGGIGTAAGLALNDVKDILSALDPQQPNNGRSVDSDNQSPTKDVKARTP
jgi:hypothetical protein